MHDIRCSHRRASIRCPACVSKRSQIAWGEVLKDIYVPETVAEPIVASLSSDSALADAERQKRMDATQQRLAALRTRMDQMYEDKLDGKMDDAFWARKLNEWREQGAQIGVRVLAFQGGGHGGQRTDSEIHSGTG